MTAENEAGAKAIGIEQVRFRAPDLDEMETFLRDFGLDRIAKSGERLEMGAVDASDACHVTTRGEPGFRGFRMAVGGEKQLRRLAEKNDSPVSETAGRPVIALEDPDGFRVEAVSSLAGVEGTTPEDRAEWNDACARRRLRERREAQPRRAHVFRLGHLVLEVSDFQASLDWYQAHFGLLVSDWVLAPETDTPFGAFLRCDKGDEPVDHHTLVLLGLGHAKFGHAAFEVLDVDDLMFGHDHLKAREYRHAWGIGRHIMGSQVFDYWLDPWGHMLEHWTDGDRLVADSPAGTRSMRDLIATQWGPHLELPA